MAVLVKGLGDRNVALKKTYAVALGHLVRVAKESSVVKLMETLENRYLEAEDEDSTCMHAYFTGYGAIQSGCRQKSFESYRTHCVFG